MALLGSACEDQPFIEPLRRSTGESQLLLLGASLAPSARSVTQGADPARLSPLGGFDSVRYRTTSQHVPMLLSGDLAAGTNFTSLELPALFPSRNERTIVTDTFTAQTWTSLRVYDRGECSQLVDWPTALGALVRAIPEQIDADPRTEGVRLVSAQTEVRLRQDFSSVDSAITFPVDADEFEIDLSIFVDRINRKAGGSWIGCSDMSIDLNIQASIVPTDYAWVAKSADAFYTACIYGTPRRLLTEVDRASARSIARFILANGTIPPGFCRPGASIDGIQLDDISRAKFRFELTHVGDESDDPVLLLGISSVDGNDLGAHDTLLDISSVEASNVHSSDCLGGIESTIIGRVVKALRQQLTTALRNQLLEQLSLDPIVFFSDRRDHVACETDADCDFTSPNGPAYQTADGEWRGGRHRCLTRDGERVRSFDPNLANLINASRPGRFCHVTLEPKRFNVRPAGFEVVIADDLDTDPQGGLIQVNPFGAVLETALCRPDRDGEPLTSDFAPRRSTRPNRFSFSGP